MDKIIFQWLQNKIYKKEIGDYLLEQNIKNIVIYGAGKLGELLYDDLLNYHSINVICFIDKNADSLYYGIDDMKIYNVHEASDIEEIKKADVIIITPYKAFNEIKNELDVKLDFKGKYLAIDDIVWAVE